jgi:hypothetical protein
VRNRNTLKGNVKAPRLFGASFGPTEKHHWSTFIRSYFRYRASTKGTPLGVLRLCILPIILHSSLVFPLSSIVDKCASLPRVYCRSSFRSLTLCLALPLTSLPFFAFAHLSHTKLHNHQPWNPRIPSPLTTLPRLRPITALAFKVSTLIDPRISWAAARLVSASAHPPPSRSILPCPSRTRPFSRTSNGDGVWGLHSGVPWAMAHFTLY